MEKKTPLPSLPPSLFCATGVGGTAENLTPEYVFNTISHVETLTENGSLTVQRTDGAHLALALSNLEASMHHSVKNGIVGGSGSDDTPAIFAATESATVYVPLFDNVLTNFQIPASAFSAPIIIRVWWQPNSYLSATLEHEITDVKLMVDSWVYDASIRQATIGKYLRSKFDFRFANTKFQKSIIQFTPNQFNTLLLSSIQGLITSMTIIFKTVGDGVVQEIQKLDLLDPSGGSMLGGAALSHAYLQATQRLRDNRYVNSVSEAVNASDKWFRLPISEEEAAHNSQGSVNGYIPMSGTHQLSIYYASSSSTALPVEVTVLYNALSTFSVNRGITSVAHS